MVEQPRRILVVDDDPTVRQICMRVLRTAGYDTHEASDGAAALDFVRKSPDKPHLVLSDIVMPRMNGVQLLEALSVLHPGLPVLLMTGYAMDALREQGISVPCGVLDKPFAPEHLLSEVHRCLYPLA
jgi:CheY-like chemotaxis protein